MKRIFNTSFFILSVFCATTVFNSCNEETITEDPEIVYDEGDRLVLNDNVIVLENSALTHEGGQQGILFDETTGVLQFDEACELGVTFPLDTGAVLHINMDNKALIRKVTSVATNNGEYILQTEKSSLHDVFDNAKIKFDFSPDYSNLQMQTKSISNLSRAELSKALTDSKGRIHPSEMYIMDGDKKITLFSVKDNMPLPATKSTSSDGRVGFEHQVNSQFYIPKLPITVGLEDFGFSLYTNLKADYSIQKHTRKFNTHLPLIGTVSAVDGVNASFVVDAEDTEINLWADLGVEARGDVPLVDEDVPLFDPKVLGFVFPVGCVPTHIHIECQLILDLDFELGGEVKVVNGLELSTTLPKMEVGANFSAIYKDWHAHRSKPHVTIDFDHKYGTIHSFETPEVKLKQRPIRYEAMAKFIHKFSIRPSLGFSIDDMAGPEIALPIYATNTMSIGAGVSINMQDTTEAPKTYVGWGSALTTNAGLKAGIWLDFLGFANKHLDIPEIPLTPDIPVWHTPGSMELVDNNNFANTVIGQEKEVEVKVEDFFTLPAPLMFVKWESGAGGTWKYPFTMTGVTGKTKNIYIPKSSGDHSPYCSVKNGNLVEVDRVTFSTTTTEK